MKKLILEKFDQTKFSPLKNEEMKHVLGGLEGALENDLGFDDGFESGGGDGQYCPTIVYNRKTKKQYVKHDC